MKMVEVKTAELVGPALDWAVAKAVHGVELELFDTCCGSGNWNGNPNEPPECCGQPVKTMHLVPGPEWRPSVDWAQCGPLIEADQVFLEPPHDVHRANYDEKTGKVKGCWKTYESWHATVSARVRTLPPKIEGFPGRVGRGEGETPLIAACRAIVKSHFDDVVSVPAELVNGGGL